VLAVVFGRFLGVLILIPGRYRKRFVPGFSFLVFGSWALLVLGVASQGVASQGVTSPGYCESWSLLVVVLEVLN
jgi:hypothetical protein